jgi:signal-transduction protein with cAMP-binding, CBS, and nucleotidyltransferase domain
MTTPKQIDAKAANEWITLVGRIITPLGIVVLILLQTQFASKTDVDALKIQVNKLENIITLLVEQQKQTKLLETKIAAIDDRTRSIEIQIARMSK